MDEFVQSFLKSEEGQEWIKSDNVQSMLEEIHLYVTEIIPISPATIKYLVRYFPELSFTGTGYRSISQPKEKETPLVWDHSHDNFSWSTHPDTYSHVLNSLTINPESLIIHVYKAQIKGLDLKTFIENLMAYQEKLKSLYGIIQKENEILVYSFSELELHQIIGE